MKRLNRFQNWMLLICRIKPFDVNQALWNRYHAGKQAGMEEGRREKAECLSCHLYQKARSEAMGAYERPDPTTYGKIAAQRDVQQPRVILQAHGRYFQERHKEFLPTQGNLPRMTRKLHLEQHSEPPSGSTPYETPAFLQDQDKSVS